jgi:hypothetical protein
MKSSITDSTLSVKTQTPSAVSELCVALEWTTAWRSDV